MRLGWSEESESTCLIGGEGICGRTGKDRQERNFGASYLSVHQLDFVLLVPERQGLV